MKWKMKTIVEGFRRCGYWTYDKKEEEKKSDEIIITKDEKKKAEAKPTVFFRCTNMTQDAKCKKCDWFVTHCSLCELPVKGKAINSHTHSYELKCEIILNIRFEYHVSDLWPRRPLRSHDRVV